MSLYSVAGRYQILQPALCVLNQGCRPSSIETARQGPPESCSFAEGELNLKQELVELRGH